MANDPILHLLGLAKKAGKLEVGEEPVGAVCRSRHARLLLLAADAAPNTCRRAAHFGEAGNVLWLQLPYNKEELGFQLGRKSCAMVAVTDFGFAASLADKLALRDPERYGPAAEQIRPKADRALQRQKEKRQHEKNLREGKRKPWVAPPVEKKSERPSGEKRSRPPMKKEGGSSVGKRFDKKRSDSRGPAAQGAHRRTGAPGKFSTKPGPGGRKLTAKPVSGGKRRAEKP